MPPALRAGDALAWSVQTALPAGTIVFFVLTAVIAGVPTRISIGAQDNTGVAVDGSGVAAFSLTSTVTKTYAPGLYAWVAFSLDSAGDRDELSQGQIKIQPDPAGTNPSDPRSRNQRILANLQALMEGKSLDDVTMYKIGGRELTKLQPTELMKWIAVYEARVKNERARRGEKMPSKTIGIMFGGRG